MFSVVFFFFKQKTAYEMRISDWSSDVCSSDLPIAEIDADGGLVITKLARTGGRVDRATCTEQLLYEMHDPARYITPDCVLDVTGVTLEETGPNRVRAAGARALQRTPSYKVTVGYFDGYIGEGQVSYAGINAETGRA